MPEWKVIVKETRMLKFLVEGTKDGARAKALEKAVSGETPDDGTIEFEVDDQVEVS